MRTPFFDCFWGALCFGSLALSGPVLGQVRVDAARQAATTTDPALVRGPEAAGLGLTGEVAPPMEGDEEFGVQRIMYRRSNWEPFAVSLDLGVNYTNNVALVDRGEEDDFFLRSGLRASYTPQLKGGLFFMASAGTEVYRYNDASFFDFDMLSLDTGLLYATPQQGTVFDPIFGDVVAHLLYRYYRISEPWRWGDNDFDNHSVAVGVQKTWRISRGHQAWLGLNADWSLEASEPEPRRDEYSATLGYRIKWTSALESSLIYRAGYYGYEEFGRDDVNQIVALDVAWKLTDWLTATASASATFNDSDEDFFDYDAFNTGVTLGLEVRW
ncbi:MAG: hypothetical protein ACKV19_09005 [Verrucomicrobiales bacterium]